MYCTSKNIISKQITIMNVIQIWKWRKLRNEELSDLYSLPNIVRVVKSRRIRWQGMWRVWGMGEVCTGF